MWAIQLGTNSGCETYAALYIALPIRCHLGGPPSRAMTTEVLLSHLGETLAHFVAAADGAMQLMCEAGFFGHAVGVF